MGTVNETVDSSQISHTSLALGAVRDARDQEDTTECSLEECDGRAHLRSEPNVSDEEHFQI
jgi:hypothetical protein